MTSQSLSSWLSIKSDDIDCGLAADFDGSLSGLGVELGSSTYNMSEALLALPVFKQESLEAGFQGGHFDFLQVVANQRCGPYPQHQMPRLPQHQLVCSRQGNQDCVPINQGNQTAPLGAPGSSSTTWVYSGPQPQPRGPSSHDDGENACHSADVSNDSQAQDVSGFSLELLRGALVASSETDDRDGNGQNGYQLGQQGSPPSPSLNVCHETDLHRSVRAGLRDDTRFQYILNAPTSPATKLNEETLTYLNQGQSYEIKLKKYGESLENTTVKSIIRVVFHDRRLQYAELEQLQLWRLGRPGERLLDLDVPLSTGIFDVVVESNRLNSVAFKWDPNKECIVFVKVHCISTEFTPKKHGGEKGVPFRVQIETYDEDNDTLRIMHCASCQVKVFKPKGADRKQKTDRDKMEKRLGAEKDKYQPSYEVTVLSELPLDQAQSYLQQLAQQERLQPEYKKGTESVSLWTQSVPQTIPTPTTSTAATDSTENDRTTTRVVSFNFGDQYSPASSVESLPFTPVSLPVSPIKPTAAKNTRPKEETAEVLPAVIPDQVEPLNANATATEVAKWLLRHRFSSYSKVFQNFAGADLLRLTRDDLIQICGLVDGIRLNNALQSKSVRPKLTIYVSQNDGKSKKSTASGSKTSTSSEKSTSPTPAATSPSETTTKPALSRLAPGSTAPAPTLTSSKRQYREAEEEEPEAHAASSSKKQRTRTLRMSQADVYHAIYLDTCTVDTLNEKIAALFMIETYQIIESIMAGPSGINILITDDVVQNFSDQSRFHVEAEQDEDATTKYRLFMKILQ